MRRRCLLRAAQELAGPGWQSAALADHRRQLLRRAEGRVLDVSDQWAANLSGYRADRVSSVTVLGPPGGGRTGLPTQPSGRAASPTLEPVVAAVTLESLVVGPDGHDSAVQSTAVHDTAVHDTAVHDTAVHDTAVHGRGTFDTIVSVLTLCTVEDVVELLGGLEARMAPGGQLLVLEHVGRPGWVGSAERLMSPVARSVVSGCNLRSDVLRLARQQGLAITDCDRFRTWAGSSLPFATVAGVVRHHPGVVEAAPGAA
jgi:hypothetical protein